MIKRHLDDVIPETPSQVLRRLKREQNVVGWSLARVLLRTELDIGDEGGWDQAPRLFIVYRTMLPTDLLESVGAAEGMALRVGEVPLPDGDWDGEKLAFALNELAEIVPTAPAELVPDNIVAWLLILEAYMQVEPGQADHVDRRKAVEVRHATAVDNAGVQYLVIRERDTDGVRLIVEEKAIASGGIYDGLTKLVEATAGG